MGTMFYRSTTVLEKRLSKEDGFEFHGFAKLFLERTLLMFAVLWSKIKKIKSSLRIGTINKMGALSQRSA